MTQKTTVFILFLLTISSLFAQDILSYDSRIEMAENFLEAEEYQNASDAYISAFRSVNENVIGSDERFDASIAFAQIQDKKSAYKQLFKIMNNGIFDAYTNYENIAEEEGLNTLHDDTKWQNFIGHLKMKQNQADNLLNKELMDQLVQLNESDQNIRKDFESITTKFGKDSDEFKTYAKNMAQIDSLNFKALQEIVSKHGWVGPEVMVKLASTHYSC